MKFEYDLFISYSRKDNKPLSGQSKGWVSRFQKYLEIRLTQLLGQKPRFLQYGNEEKPAASELIKSCILISVVSPHYISESDNIEDLELFYKEAEKQDLLKTTGHNRIFKVVKYPVPPEQQPSKIRHLLGVDMYELNAATGEASELNDFFIPEAESTFWMRLDDLAHNIYDILKEISISRPAHASGEQDTVYLAETGHDLTIERDLIRRELQRHGYRVLPDHQLPTNVKEMEATIRKDLQECRLSIHLIGDVYGEVPSGSDRSIVDIQNQIAAEHSSHSSAIPSAGSSAGFSRLIWIAPYAKLTNEKQKLFIENIKRDAEGMSGAEVVQTPLEDLKNIIRNELLHDHSGRPSGMLQARAQGKPSFYLIFDQTDEQGGQEIAAHLRNQGNEVYIPSFKGELLEVRNHHFDHLRKCDVALIYYGKASEQWVQMKVLDVLKAPGLGRSRQMLAKAIFVEKGPRLNKEKFRNYDIAIIENTGGLLVSLEPLLAKLNK